MRFHVGDRVEVSRDETIYPSRGSWPRYRGKHATVVSCNRIDDEVGVILGDANPRDLGRARAQAWFKSRELRLVTARSR